MTIKGFQTEIKITELSDVDVSGSPGLSTGDALIFNTATQKFEQQPTPIFTGLGALPDVTLSGHGSPVVAHLEKELLSYNADINQWVDRRIPEAGLMAASTGLMEGGKLIFGTPNGSPLTGSPPTTTLFTIEPGSGVVVDNYTDPQHPTYTNVSWTDEYIDQSITSIAVADRTFVAIDSTGAILQQTTDFTPAEHRDIIHIGTIGHANRTNVVAIRSNPHAAFDVNNRLGDLAEALGAFNISGNIYTYNGTNLNIDKSAGESYRLGNNFHISKASPDISSSASETALSFIYAYRNDIAGTTWTLEAATTAINPQQYDLDGTLTTLGGGKWSVQTIKYFPGGAGTRIEYGQVQYDNEQAALEAIPLPSHVHNSAFIEGIIRGYLIVKKDNTELDDPTEAIFIEASAFGGGGGSTGTTSVFSAAFESTELPIATPGDHFEAHGLGTVPQGTQAFLRCVNPELGYDVGDEVEFMNWDGVASYKGLHSDASDIHWQTGPDILITSHAVGSPLAGGSAIININKWKIILRAYA